MAKISVNVYSNIIVKKIKNLLKVKNIKKLAKAKKLDFVKAKANETSKIGFFTPKANIAFT